MKNAAHLPVLAFAGSAVIYGFGDVTRKGLSLFLGLIAARYLGYAQYGTLSLLQAFASLALVFYSMGIHGGLAAFYHKTNELEYHDLVNTAFSFYVASAAILSTILILLAMAGAFDVVLNLRETGITAFALIVLFCAFNVSTLFQEAVYVQKQWYRRNTSLVVASAVAEFVLATMSLMVFRNIESMLLSLVVVRVGLFIWVWKGARLWEWQWQAPRLARLKPVLFFSLPLVPHLVSQWVIGLSDRTILIMLTDTVTVGVYSLGYNLGMSLLVVVGILGAVFGPLYLKDYRQDIRRFRTHLFWPYILILSCAIPVLMFVVSKIVKWMEFASASLVTEVAFWTIGSYYLFGIYAFFSNELFARGKTQLLAMVTAASAVVNVTLTLALVPYYAAVGAAVATFYAYLCMAGVTALLAWNFHTPFEQSNVKPC